MLALLRRLGARIASTVVDADGKLRPETVDETIRLFTDAKLLTIVDGAEGGDGAIYAIPEERRIALEYHKNTILHFFVPSALIASALLALGGEAEREILRERVRRLSRLFKLEFMYRADADFDEIFADALDSMTSSGEIEIAAELIRRGGGAAGARVSSYAEMLRTYFESYRTALFAVRALRDPKAPAIAKKDWTKQALALGHRRWLTGQLTLRESLSRPKLENALAALHDHQIIRIEGEQIRQGAAPEAGGELDRVLVEHLIIE
jgi:glycerol-3-phosphate O-acyltransferase